jgi:hypothetical protein
MKDFISSLVKNKNGDTVIFQRPNFLIYAWITCLAFSWLINQTDIQNGFRTLASATLFAWAYLEITKGESRFRQILGLVVISGIIIGFFKS